MKHLKIYMMSFFIIFMLNNCSEPKPHLKQKQSALVDKAINDRLRYVDEYMKEHYGS